MCVSMDRSAFLGLGARRATRTGGSVRRASKGSASSPTNSRLNKDWTVASKSQTVSNLCTTYTQRYCFFSLVFYFLFLLFFMCNRPRLVRNTHIYKKKINIHFFLCLSMSEVTSHILFNRGKPKIKKEEQGSKCGVKSIFLFQNFIF